MDNFLKYSIKSIDNLNKYCKNTYKVFIDTNYKIKGNLVSFSNEISLIKLEKFSIFHIAKIGNFLKSFYELYTNKLYKSSIKYALNLHYYIKDIDSIQNNITIGNLNYCKFTKKNTNFTGAYFASLINCDT